MGLDANGNRAGFDGPDARIRRHGAVGARAERDLPAVDVRRGLEGTIGGRRRKGEEGAVEGRGDVGGVVVWGQGLRERKSEPSAEL